MSIKTIFGDIKKELSAWIYKADDGGKLTTAFFNPWDKSRGIIQPTNFVEQVEANTSWVYACVMVIAETMAMTPLMLKAKKGEEIQTISDHIFLDTFTSVNPFMNNFELRELTEIYQLLTGNAYWYLVKNKLGVPVEIWPVPSQYMRVVPDPVEFVKGYVFTQPGTEPIAFAADEIVHFKYPNPNNVFYGLGTLSAAAYEVDNNTAMNKYQSTMFDNQGVPQGLLSSDQVINKADSDRMREQWNQLYRGPDNAGKIAILSKGLKYTQIQMTAQEMAYIQSKTITRDSILGIFRVPKSILGVVEDVNRANAEASEYTFNLHTIKPKLIRSQEKINEKIMPLYVQRPGVKLFVEYTDPVPANRDLENTERATRLDKAITTINEERARLGFPSVAWGDVPILPMNLIPFGSTPDTTAPAPAATTEPLTDTGKAATKAQLHDTQSAGSLRRAKVWTEFKARFDTSVYTMRRHLIPLFREQEKEVLKNLNRYFGKGINKDAIDGILFDFEDWQKEFVDACGGDIDAAYKGGVKDGEQQTGINFNLDNPRAQKYLKEKKFRFSFETNKTTQEQLRKEIGEGLRTGESGRDIAARVAKVFNFAEKYRAERIARTETTEVSNKALDDVYKTSDKITGKQWLHGGGGDNPRPEHIEMDGETVDVDEQFSNGLKYPGDPAEGPGEICNCTCTMIAVMKE